MAASRRTRGHQSWSWISIVSDDLTNLIRLNLVPGIGPRLQDLLLSRFGSAVGVFEASPEISSVYSSLPCFTRGCG